MNLTTTSSSIGVSQEQSSLATFQRRPPSANRLKVAKLKRIQTPLSSKYKVSKSLQILHSPRRTQSGFLSLARYATTARDMSASCSRLASVAFVAIDLGRPGIARAKYKVE